MLSFESGICDKCLVCMHIKLFAYCTLTGIVKGYKTSKEENIVDSKCGCRLSENYLCLDTELVVV